MTNRPPPELQQYNYSYRRRLQFWSFAISRTELNSSSGVVQWRAILDIRVVRILKPYLGAINHLLLLKFQAVCSLICIAMNCYLLLALSTTKDLRKLNFYPILLQAFCDLLGSGVAGLVHYIGVANLMNSDLRQNTKLFQVFVSDGLTSFVKEVNRKAWQEEKYRILDFWINCVPQYLLVRFTEYSTGPITLVLAFERFLMVVKPFSYKSVINRRKRSIMYIILTSTILSITVLDLVSRYFSYTAYSDCSYGFLGRKCSRLYFMFSTSFVFFIIPGTVSLILYAITFYKLLRKKTNVGRNRVLTIALFFSCVSWITLWSIGMFCYAFLVTNTLRLYITSYQS